MGKSTHHGTALPADGRITFDKPLPNGEPQLRELFACLKRQGNVPGGDGRPRLWMRSRLSARPVDAPAGRTAPFQPVDGPFACGALGRASS
ncbi:hypothetical protein GCM10022403_045550 [Streptomyces coacervatus]|uniref:Transposase n=1 Tax=Streptomyces coacervatus TaxID=647381 RepID=A0ABP7I3Z5_9ACTN